MKNQVITINSETNMDLYASLNGKTYESIKMFSGDLINITSSLLNQVRGTKCIIYVNVKGEPQEYYQIMTWGAGEVTEVITEIMLNSSA